MADYPHPPIVAGILAFLCVRKLCETLERENKLAPSETGRIWAEIVAELEPQRGQDTVNACLSEIARLRLTPS